MQTINDRIGIIIEQTGMTKTAFAESLKVSQQYISKLIKSGNPSERLIDDICEKVKINDELINKNWLITGVGDITIKRTRNQVIQDFANDVMEEMDDSFRKRFVRALSKLDESDWVTIEKIVSELSKED